MSRAYVYTIATIVNLSFIVFFCSDLFAQPVRFDCPAVSSARLVDASDDRKVIEIRVPISMSALESNVQVDELKAEISWNRNANPIVNYGPSTLLQSKFDGPVAVEKKSESQRTLAAKVSTSYVDLVSPSLEADLKKTNTETRSFDEVPEHDLVVASGPIQRGTGAYFSFLPSRTETLEGGRELVVAFDVPAYWRSGMLQVTMTAIGRQRKLGFFSEELDFARIFMLPIYLEGDDQARRAAFEFSRSEQRLRQGWELFRTVNKQHPTALSFEKWFAGSTNQVPDMWVHHLIQSGSDAALDQVENRLPAKITIAANQFVEARKNLLSLSR